MKTVGIITTFRQPNYGSVLQAYALQKTINDLGYNSKVIDYIYPNSYHISRGKRKFKEKVGLKSRVAIKLGLRSQTKMQLLNDFIKKEMQVTKEFGSFEMLHENPPKFDVYISGSDQIWNPNTMLGDMSYLLDFVPDDRLKISYSSSFACNSIPESLTTSYKENLNRYALLSVREDNGKKLIKELIGKDSNVVLDPTLLLNKNDWATLANKSKKIKYLPSKYILFYMLAYTYNPEDKMAELLSVMQKKYNLPIISLSKKPQGFDGVFTDITRNNSIGINEFLYLFNNAKMVITSSFHGTAFAINFGIPLITLTNNNVDSDDRIATLMKSLSVENCCIDATTKIEDIANPFYDIKKMRHNLDIVRNNSLNFLITAFS